MIKNYLDYVKGMRRNNLILARQYAREAREEANEFIRGHCKGMRLAYGLSSRHWRTLQKDIEARQDIEPYVELSPAEHDAWPKLKR